MDGFGRVLLEEYGGALDQRGQEYLRFIRDGAAELGRQIGAIVEMLRLSAMELRVARVDLGALARDVLGELRAADPDRAVEVAVADAEGALEVTGDARLLRILLASLVGNAWRFTRSSAAPRIEVGAEGQAGAGPRFFVRDNGVGFDMTYADRLFRPFGRLHPPGPGAGPGMGLALARQVVLRHGGLIWAEGVVGQGATFSFTLGEPVPLAGGSPA
jgi:signal transduction histidine kinase